MKNLVTPLGYDRLFDSFELSLKADGLRPHTISCYIRDVRRFWGYAQPEDPRAVTADQIREFVTSLRDQLAPKTVHTIQIGLTLYFKLLIVEDALGFDLSNTVASHTLSICRSTNPMWHTASHRRSLCMEEWLYS